MTAMRMPSLFLLLVSIAAISPAVAGRITPLTEDRQNSNTRKQLFDTSNYGKLQLNNGLALTPQMGWNSWNFFACQINETVVKETADALISTGLADLGYKYVNIDDCWSSLLRNFKFGSSTMVLYEDGNFFLKEEMKQAKPDKKAWTLHGFLSRVICGLQRG